MAFGSIRKIDFSVGLKEIGPLDDLLVVKLGRLQVFLSHAFFAASQQENLRSGVISSLALISANPGISQNDISQYIGIDQSAIVQIIDYLEDAGWVVREKSPNDRRRYALRATPQGEARLESLAEAVRKIENNMLAMISEEEIKAFGSLVNRMCISCIEHGSPVAAPQSDGENNRPRQSRTKRG